MVRGPDWSRLRTAMPSIIAGRYLESGRGGGINSWIAAASLTGFGQVTLFEAMERQETLYVRDVEGASTEKVSPEIPKDLDDILTSDEVTAVKNKLASKGVRMVAYDVPSMGSDEAENRKLFEFAKGLDVLTIVSDPAPGALPLIDKLANEFDINVAILNHGKAEQRPCRSANSPRSVDNLSKRVGACVDTASWMQEGIHPVEGVTIIGGRVIAVHLLDRSAPGKRP